MWYNIKRRAKEKNRKKQKNKERGWKKFRLFSFAIVICRIICICRGEHCSPVIPNILIGRPMVAPTNRIFQNINCIAAGSAANSNLPANKINLRRNNPLRFTFLVSQNKTDKSAAALVDNSLQGFLQFHSRLNRHFVKLVVKSLVDKFME